MLAMAKKSAVLWVAYSITKTTPLQTVYLNVVCVCLPGGPLSPLSPGDPGYPGSPFGPTPPPTNPLTFGWDNQNKMH